MAAGLADPGNVGTILRAAEAAGADGVVLAGSVDVFNPKVVRASAGALFHVPVVVDVAPRPGRARASLWAAVAGWVPYDEAPSSGRALVLGSEAHGLPVGVPVDGIVSIPHAGRAESLNVAMAAAVLSSRWPAAPATARSRRAVAGSPRIRSRRAPEAAGPGPALGCRADAVDVVTEHRLRCPRALLGGGARHAALTAAPRVPGEPDSPDRPRPGCRTPPRRNSKEAPPTLAPMIDDVAAPLPTPVARISAAATLDDLRALDAELLGKRGALADSQAAPRPRSTPPTARGGPGARTGAGRAPARARGAPAELAADDRAAPSTPSGST